MTRVSTVILIVLAAMTVSACGERPQTAGAASRKSDAKPWETNAGAFAAPGYQGGDQARWEAQLRQRAQAQNDYAAAQ